MEDALNFVFHGCFLAREFESSLPNEPNELYKSCQAIAEAFTRAMNCLDSRNPPTYLLCLPDVNGGQQPEFAGIPLEFSRAMDHVMPSNGVDFLVQVGGCSVQSMETAVAEQSVSGAAAFPVLKKRRGSYEKRTMRVPAPPIGNSDSMPDDGYTWRKYGQKEILGSLYPRSYYRCSNKTLYGCDAKKQMQRTDEDPCMYEITYCGHHTCHIIPPPPAPANRVGTAEQERLEILPAGGYAGVGPQLPVNEAQVRTMEQLQLQLLDYGDVIFNSGSSSSNSMDSFFSPKGERGD